MLRRLLTSISLVLLLCAASPAQETITQKDLMEHLLREESAHGGAPIYPPLARQARIEGTVVLDVSVDADGKVHDVRVVSGHPMLSPTAIETANGWRFRPFVIDDTPVEVEARVSVVFKIRVPSEEVTHNFDEDFEFEMNRANASMEIYREEGLAEAEEHANKALDLARQQNRPWEQGRAMLLLAQIHEGQKKDAAKDYDEGVRLIRLARSAHRVTSANPALADAFYQAGLFFFHAKKYDSAESTLADAINVWRLSPPQNNDSKARFALAASMAAASSVEVDHPRAAATYCEIFRRSRSALRGLELDEAQQRCRQIH